MKMNFLTCQTSQRIHARAIYVHFDIIYLKMTDDKEVMRVYSYEVKKTLEPQHVFFYMTRLELSSICTSYDPRQGPTDAPERPSGASISLHRAEKGRQGFYIFGSDMM